MKKENTKITIALSALEQSLREVETSYAALSKDKKKLVVFEITGDTVSISSSDDQIQVIRRVKGKDVVGGGKYVLEVSDIAKFISAFSKASSALSVSDVVLEFSDSTLKISNSEIGCEFPCLDKDLASAFIAQDFTSGTKIKLPMVTLKELIHRTQLFANTKNTSQKFFAMIHFKFTNTSVEAGSILDQGVQWYKKEADKGESFVLPKKKSKSTSEEDQQEEPDAKDEEVVVCEEFCIHRDHLKSFDFEGENIIMLIQKDIIIATDSQKVVAMRRNDANYKNVHDFLVEFGCEKEHANDFNVKKSSFVSSINLASSVENPTDDTLHFEAVESTLKVYRKQGAKSQLDCTIKQVEEGNCIFRLNPRWMKSIAMFTSAEVNIAFESTTTPIFVKSGSENEFYIQLLVPFKLDEKVEVEQDEEDNETDETKDTENEANVA